MKNKTSKQEEWVETIQEWRKGPVGLYPPSGSLAYKIVQALQQEYKRGVEDNEIDHIKRLEISVAQERQSVIEEVEKHCICHPTYKKINRVDPQCQVHDILTKLKQSHDKN